MTSAQGPDPFTVLGLPARPDLADEQVRTAWRVIATLTHPDRADGGDPARYAAASAAYAALRTPWARSEARADLAPAAPPPRSAGVLAPPAPPAARPRRSPSRALVLLPARVRNGRPGRLALRVAAAAVLAVAVIHTDAAAAPVAGVVTGLATWLALTAGADLAPPPGR